MIWNDNFYCPFNLNPDNCHTQKVLLNFKEKNIEIIGGNGLYCKSNCKKSKELKK